MNPFSAFGTVAEPHRFVGRKQEIREITNRVLQPNGYGSIAIVGESRIGKTSLMYFPFEIEKERLFTNKYIVVDMGSIARFEPGNAPFFFQQLLRRAHRILSKHPDYVSTDLYNSIASSSESLTEDMFEYLAEVKGSGFRLIYLLDEFDSIESIFSGRPEAYHCLRSMGDGYQHKVSFVVTTRRPVAQLGRTFQGFISPFPTIFQELYLGLMSEEDILCLIANRLQEPETPFLPAEVREILRIAGRHPFFVDLFCYYLYEERKNQSSPSDLVERALEQSRGEFYKSFNNFRGRLGEDKFGLLLDLVSGTVQDYSMYGELTRLGHVIQENCNGNGKISLKPFGDMYCEFLQRYAKQQDRPSWLKDDVLWGLIRQTERELRRLIENIFQENEAQGWEYKLEKVARQIPLKGGYPTLYDSWLAKRDSERNSFRNYDDIPILPILDYSYIGELGQIISKEWRLFKPIFYEPAFINKVVSEISRVRNPEAHFREDIIPENEFERARVACRDVLNAILRYEKAKAEPTQA